MEVAVGVGAVVDLATTDDLRHEGESIRAMLRRQQGKSNIRRGFGVVNVAGGANGQQYAIDCFGASSGRITDVRTVAVVGLDANGQPFQLSAAANALGMLMVSSHPPANGPANDFDPSALASEPFAIPAARYFGRGQLVLDARSHLYVWVKLTAAAPAGLTQLVASFTAVEATIDSDLMEDL